MDGYIPRNAFSAKTIKHVEFPKALNNEGSPANIFYTDGSIERTTADKFYMRCTERKLTKEQINDLIKGE